MTPHARSEIAGAVTDFAIGEAGAKRLADPSFHFRGPLDNPVYRSAVGR